MQTGYQVPEHPMTNAIEISLLSTEQETVITLQLRLEECNEYNPKMFDHFKSLLHCYVNDHSNNDYEVCCKVPTLPNE